MFGQFGPRDQTPVILQLFVGPPATHYAPGDRSGWRVGFTCHPAVGAPLPWEPGSGHGMVTGAGQPAEQSQNSGFPAGRGGCKGGQRQSSM